MYCTASPLGSFESRLFRAICTGVSGGNSAAATYHDFNCDTEEFSFPGVTNQGGGVWLLDPGTYFVQLHGSVYAVGHSYFRITKPDTSVLYSNQVFSPSSDSHEINVDFTFKITVATAGNMTVDIYTENAVVNGLGSSPDANGIVRYINIWRLY